MGFFSDIGESLFGTQTKAAAREQSAQGAANEQTAMTGAQAATDTANRQGATADMQAAANQAQSAEYRGQGGKYDTGVASSMGANAGKYMAKANAAAAGEADKQGQQAATQGSQAALQAARSMGSGRGTSALLAAQGAAGTYQGAANQAQQRGVQQYVQGTQQFGQQGAEMANRAAQQQQLAAQQQGLGLEATGQAGTNAATMGNIATGQQAAATAGTEAANATAANTWGTIGNLAGAGATLLSDERAKKNIDDTLGAKLDTILGRPRDITAILASIRKPDIDTIAETVKPITFDYKDEPDGTGHMGVTAQDLEKTALKNVVHEGADGMKGIDTAELSASNLNLIIQLARKVDELQKKVGV